MADGASTRYADLLKPIKDSAKNMELDLAAHLEEYLEELKDMVVSFDGGITTMNFTEAAMLLQSSAGVYSKKVEYLSSLVTEMLDVLASKRIEERRYQADEDETATEGSETGHQDMWEDQKLPSLDDNKTCKCTMRDVNKAFNFLKRPQKSFAPKLKSDSGGNILLSETGEELASLEDFRSNTCSVYGPMNLLMVNMQHLPLAKQLPHPPTTEKALQVDTIEGKPTAEGGGIEICHDPAPEDTEAYHMEDAMEAEDGMPSLEVSMHNHRETDTSTEVLSANSKRRSERQRQRQTQAAVAPKQKADPWKLLDPYEETGKPKPPKKGVCYKLPRGLENKEQPPKEPLTEFIEKAFYSNAKKYPKNPMKCITFPALDKLFWKECQRRKRMEQEWKAKRRAQNIIFGTEQGELSEEEEESEEEIENYPGAGDAAEEDYQSLEPTDELLNAINEGLRANQEQLQGMPRNNLADTEDGSVILEPEESESYEDLLKRHVEQYFKSVEDYLDSTDLSRRVDEWQNKITPSLSEEGSREPFDIKTYSQRVMDKLEPGKCVPFILLVAGKADFEVCRTFLTMLMLANTQNVEIHSTGGSNDLDNINVQLLSKRRHFEELADYEAPSQS